MQWTCNIVVVGQCKGTLQRDFAIFLFRRSRIDRALYNYLMWTHFKLFKISRLSVDNQPWTAESHWMFPRRTSCSKNFRVSSLRCQMFSSFSKITSESADLEISAVGRHARCVPPDHHSLSVGNERTCCDLMTVLLTVWTLALSAAAETPSVSVPH